MSKQDYGDDMMVVWRNNTEISHYLFSHINDIGNMEGWQVSLCADASIVIDRLREEVRRLREENERLRIENAALRADSARIDWLADVNNTVGSVVLPREIVEANVSSLRQAIDAARGAS